MKARSAGWVDHFRSLGSAFLELLRAELAALGQDMGRSGRTLLRAVLLLLVALFVLFWGLGMVAFVGVEVLALWLPRWGAALTVLGSLLLVALALAAVGWWRLRRLELPAATVRRRLEDHREWWQRTVAPLSEAEEDAPEEGPGEGT